MWGGDGTVNLRLNRPIDMMAHPLFLYSLPLLSGWSLGPIGGGGVLQGGPLPSHPVWDDVPVPVVAVSAEETHLGQSVRGGRLVHGGTRG